VWRRYQLDFRTPGIIPFKDKSRKQIRHKPNFRKYARERPQRWQRLCCRTANFGLRLLFSTMALRAIYDLPFVNPDIGCCSLPPSPVPLPYCR